MTRSDQIEDTAARLDDAQARATTTPPTAVDRELDLANGYAVQEHRQRHALTAHGPLAGYKIGLTSPVAQAQFGATEPISGFLTGPSALTADDDVSLAGLTTPKAELEFGFVMGQSVTGPVTADDVLAMTEAVLLCVEVVDSRWQGGASNVAMLVADNSYAARAVTGPTIDVIDHLDQAEVVATIGASHVTGSGANVLGHPARAVAWLAAHLENHGERLKAGDLVLTGTLTPPVDVRAGDALHADFGELGTISVRFTN